MTHYDFVAIGGGNAGLTAAARVAAAGRRTALIDRGPVGGLCSLNGCNPKKVLVRSTEVLDEVRGAGAFGIAVEAPRVAWERVIDRKETFTSPVTAATERSLAEQGIDLLRGTPRFVGPRTLDLAGERIEAGAVLVATGSTPRPFTFPGAGLLKISDDLLALRTVPPRLAVIGAGVIAFELGQVYARAGSRVTILTPGKRALSGHDDDLVDAVTAFSAGLGIELVPQVTVHAVREGAAGLEVEFSVDGRMRALSADVVLNAAGRVASIGDLDLAAAGVAQDARGVVVDDFLRSPSNRCVLAAGDAHGRRQLSPVASYEGRVAARNLLEGDCERADYGAIPTVVFTLPQLAAVGPTEAEARARGLDVTVVSSDMASWKVYAILGEQVARAKVILERGSGRIVGAHIFGLNAGELINLFAMAIRFGVAADDLRRMVFTYPTLSSAIPSMLG